MFGVLFISRETTTLFQYQDRLSGYYIHIIRIRRSWDRFIFIMKIIILVRHVYIQTVPSWCVHKPFLCVRLWGWIGILFTDKYFIYRYWEHGDIQTIIRYTGFLYILGTVPTFNLIDGIWQRSNDKVSYFTPGAIYVAHEIMKICSICVHRHGGQGFTHLRVSSVT